MLTLIKWLQNNKEWVFSGIGVAGVSSLLSWIISQKSNARASLKVNVSFGFLAFGPELSDQMLFVTVSNTGERAIQIAGIKIPLSQKRNLFFPHLRGEKTIPCLVELGTNVKFWTDLKELEGTLRSRGYTGTNKIRAVVTDGTGTEHKSNSVKLTL